MSISFNLAGDGRRGHMGPLTGDILILRKKGSDEQGVREFFNLHEFPQGPSIAGPWDDEAIACKEALTLAKKRQGDAWIETSEGSAWVKLIDG
jgi:hypothetical protein